jgi:UrcA family protein
MIAHADQPRSGKTTMNWPMLIAALAASCPLAPAVGQELSTSIVVDGRDLDLKKPRHVARLDARIARAASEACGNPSVADLVGLNAHRRCTLDAIASVRTQRDGAVLGSKMHDGGPRLAR